MGLLNLSGILKTAGAGFAGYGADKQQIVQQAVQQRAAERQSRLDAIQEALARRTLATPIPLQTVSPGAGVVQPDGSVSVPVPAPPKNIDPLSPEGLAAAAKKPPPEITPFQQAQLDIERQRIAQQTAAQAAKAKVPTPDQVKMSTVNDLAGPAANNLLAYYSEAPSSIAEHESAALRHIPLLGNKAANYADEGFQTALNNADVLATQYLEAMPKSRFQVSTVDEIRKQIAPVPGDSPVQRQQKAQRVRELQRAIAKRATLRPDDPGPALDDVPEFPLPDGSN